ncbi:hypothetical protein EYF80_040160 [Liparis tanakae]|uniref:Uncharacterized protein n=1 Tax=Liparis tanakae TaxID=230148 RepID=A0A4Z2G9L9_9TELE|nr:hypothetical protein EYF80_040160 [Liparis tanakae]
MTATMLLQDSMLKPSVFRPPSETDMNRFNVQTDYSQQRTPEHVLCVDVTSELEEQLLENHRERKEHFHGEQTHWLFENSCETEPAGRDGDERD